RQAAARRVAELVTLVVDRVAAAAARAERAGRAAQLAQQPAGPALSGLLGRFVLGIGGSRPGGIPGTLGPIHRAVRTRDVERQADPAAVGQGDRGHVGDVPAWRGQLEDATARALDDSIVAVHPTGRIIARRVVLPRLAHAAR